MRFIKKNNIIKIYLLLLLTTFISEVFFRVVMKYDLLSAATLRIFIGLAVIMGLFSLLISFVKPVFERIITLLIIFLVGFYQIIQIGSFNYLGVYLSLGTSSQAGAITSYIKDYLSSFHPNYFLVFIPFVLALAYYIFEIIYNTKHKEIVPKRITKKYLVQKEIETIATKKYNKICRILLVCVTLLMSGLYYFTLVYSKLQNPLQLEKNIDLYVNPSNVTISVNQFGPTMYFTLDVRTTLFPVKETNITTNYKKSNKNIIKTDYTREIDDTAWLKLQENTSNKNYQALNNYFMSRDITPKNDYTGLFAGKNVIFIMMESTNTLLINEKDYPTIYKLYTEGFAWENAYSPRNACSTGNNEMSGMVSLYTIYRSCTYNNYKNNTYFESIFNLFNNAGYHTTSYHNYTDQYYNRTTVHPNMGSSEFYGVKKLKIDYSNEYREWPSDIELMDKASDIFLNHNDNKPFMAWITTVTPHQPYNVKSTYGDKYLDLYEDTGYPTNLKRYLSKLTELDKALEELLKRLDDAGELENTVLVMYADHYPYGLPDNTLQKAFDYDITKNYEVDRTPFIIYNAGTQGKLSSNLTSYMNIVPTVANLFDLDYDPRLYMGQDLFSETFNNRLVFADGSWQTKDAFYNATSGKISYYGDVKYTNEQIIENNQEIRDMIKMSNLAITSNYFDYLGKGLKKYQVVEKNNESVSNEVN